MRSLVLSGEYPWPVNSGSRIRLLSVLRGLARCGPTELFSIIPRGRTDLDPPDDSTDLARVGWMGFDDRPATGLQAVTGLVRRGTPLELPWRDGPEATRAVARFMSGHYDLLWYFGIRPWVLVGGRDASPTVLDFIDLEDQKIAARMSVTPQAATVRQRLGRSFSKEEQRRWRRLQQRGADGVTTPVVCSTLDARRAEASGIGHPRVVANGYRWVEHPLGRTEVGQPPTVMFAGTLRYPPNAQAARFLVGEVGPALRRLVPEARLRLVGVATREMTALEDPPTVTFTGLVPDIDGELAKADVVVVPIRFGSGTRLKVIEAFAQRIPVVSTTLGAEGLGVEDGRHLLIADDAEGIAGACAQLLTDTALRRRLTEAAHQLFDRQFRMERIEEQVESVARATVADQA